MSALTNYWQSLKPQEQRLLSIAGVIFIIFFFVMVIYRPLNNAVADAKQELSKQQELLQFVQQSVVQIKAKGGSVKAVSGGNVTQVVNSTRSRYQIEISRMQPSGEGLRLNIDSVPFNQLLAWLDDIVKNHGVTISNIELSLDPKPGYVRVSRIVLE
ncbi:MULTISPECIES: type II secretion system protein GspM [unclassified Pseudoalteromonas]|uniref:type II secretion system protein GspM n=1 Tax=unclassified Pseudoalteromonas TaxID=194690 RepID=UPI000CF60368|nr:MULTISPECIES: type II secretion system protein M [unclassified Pseudoalteromonas]MBS3797233.1 type II secretion system protein M [Pseudoalteromonas sp. BDTF-M6]